MLFSFQAPVGGTVTINFNAFDLEPKHQLNDGRLLCYFDYVEVFHDPPTHNGIRNCGDTLPPSYTSTGRQLRIVFKTDSVDHFQGFSWTYTMNTSYPPLPGAASRVQPTNWSITYCLALIVLHCITYCATDYRC